MDGIEGKLRDTRLRDNTGLADAGPTTIRRDNKELRERLTVKRGRIKPRERVNAFIMVFGTGRWFCGYESSRH